MRHVKGMFLGGLIGRRALNHETRLSYTRHCERRRGLPRGPSRAFGETGALSTLMAQHLLAMNVIAPLIAVLLARPQMPMSIAALCWSALVQIAVFWLWHAPALQGSASQSPTWHLLMLATLTGASSIFWWAVISVPRSGRWPQLGRCLPGKVWSGSAVAW